jgi:hypothetical protein
MVMLEGRKDRGLAQGYLHEVLDRIEAIRILGFDSYMM